MDSILLLDCTKIIRGIIENTQFESVCESFQVLITNFKKVVLNFEGQDICKSQCRTKFQDLIFLCFSQLRKSLLMMTSLLESSLKFGVVPAESKSYICGRMISCLDKLNELSHRDSICVESDDDDEDLSGGLFIVRMDQALSLLAVFEAGLSETFTEEKSISLLQWKKVVDNLLGHAMSIAQVASCLDLTEIQCSCEKILREFESLRMEYEKANKNVCECKLYTVSLTAALEKLEQRVCSAVLKMHLLVFSDCSAPLRALVRACWKEPGSIPIPSDRERSADDVERLVSAFDQHMDQMIQVALFAVACSTSQSLVRSIRSCLASLESLEPHLVPALQALYLRRSDREELKHFVRSLSEHWNDEVESLNGFIDLVVDPVALAQVAFEEARVPAASLKKAIACGKSVSLDTLATRKVVEAVAAPASALLGQLSTLGKSPDIKPSAALESGVQDLRKALLHLKDSRFQQETDDLNKRVVRRCEVVVSCIKRLILLLEEALNAQSEEGAPPSPLKFPDSVRDLLQDTSSLVSSSQLGTLSDTPADKELSKVSGIHLQLGQGGRASLRSISILYKEKKTPKRESTGSKLLRSVLTENARRTGLQRRSSVFNRTGNFPQDSTQTSVLQETLGLTALLDNLSSVSESLKSGRVLPIKRVGNERGSNPDLSDDEYASCEEISVASGQSASICTPQRLKDLADLRERIEALRKAHDVP